MRQGKVSDANSASTDRLSLANLLELLDEGGGAEKGCDAWRATSASGGGGDGGGAGFASAASGAGRHEDMV